MLSAGSLMGHRTMPHLMMPFHSSPFQNHHSSRDSHIALPKPSSRSRLAPDLSRVEISTSCSPFETAETSDPSPSDGAWPNLLPAKVGVNRRARRTMFGFRDWERARSSKRFFHHVQTIVSSGIIQGVKVPVLRVSLLSVVIATWNSLHNIGHLPAWLPHPPSIAIECCSITSFALSLLLVFRTNASYARWEEARRSFGRITTRSRDLARVVYTWCPDVGIRKALSRWLNALAKSSMMHLRKSDEHDFDHELGKVLLHTELEVLRQSTNRPAFCIAVVSRIIERSNMPELVVHRANENISEIVGAVSACERILNTPIPLSYTRHTGRFLMLWMGALPFTLWQYAGWAMVLITALVSFVLLGIEEIGVYIEEPFSLLPLEGLAARLALALSRMAEDHAKINTFLDDTIMDKTLTPDPVFLG
eukprot:gene22581-29714_t